MPITDAVKKAETAAPEWAGTRVGRYQSGQVDQDALLETTQHGGIQLPGNVRRAENKHLVRSADTCYGAD